MMEFKITKELILDIFLPRFCLGCGKEGDYICQNCQDFLGETELICPVCEKSSFFGQRHKNCSSRYQLEGLTSIWEYEGIIRELIHKAKYRGITHPFSEAVVSALEIMLKDKIRFKPFFDFLFSPATCISYVPMFRKKEKQRGFNQARLIAQEIGKITEKPVFDLLTKIKDTQSQTDLSREQRVENVKDSFLLRKPSSENKLFSSSPLFAPRPSVSGLTAPKPHDSKSSFSPLKSNILLVDDIWTTGATMRECCKVLKNGGAEQVWGFTIARTV